MLIHNITAENSVALWDDTQCFSVRKPSAHVVCNFPEPTRSRDGLVENDENWTVWEFLCRCASNRKTGVQRTKINVRAKLLWGVDSRKPSFFRTSDLDSAYEKSGRVLRRERTYSLQIPRRKSTVREEGTINEEKQQPSSSSCATTQLLSAKTVKKET